jgi:hypothetical protein
MDRARDLWQPLQWQEGKKVRGRDGKKMVLVFSLISSLESLYLAQHDHVKGFTGIFLTALERLQYQARLSR